MLIRRLQHLGETSSPRDNRPYRAAFARRNRPTGDPHDYHRQRPADRPPPAGRCAGPARRRPGGGRRPGVPPLRPHQARLRRPVEAFQRMVRLGGPPLPAGRTPHRRPLPGGAGRRWRQRCHPAPRRQRHRQGPRVGRPRIALPGPRCARLFERTGPGVWPGPGARPAPSPPTCWL